MRICTLIHRKEVAEHNQLSSQQPYFQIQYATPDWRVTPIQHIDRHLSPRNNHPDTEQAHTKNPQPPTRTKKMNNNIIIAMIVVILLGITGLVYLYSIRWRSQARAQLFIARAKARKRRISESQAQLQAQATTPIQVTVVRGPSRAPSRRPSPRPPASRPFESQRPPPPPPPPPRAASTTSRQGQRGRGRQNERQDNRRGSGSGTSRNQSRVSKNKNKKQKGEQQTGQIVHGDNAAGSGGGNQPAQQECSNQGMDNEWGVGLAEQDNAPYTGPQDEPPQPGPIDDEWRASNEAAAGSSGGPTSPNDDWPNTGDNEGPQEATQSGWQANDAMEQRDNGGQREASQGTWHANDAMEQRPEQQKTDLGNQSW